MRIRYILVLPGLRFPWFISSLILSCAGVIGKVLCDPVALVDTEERGDGLRLGMRLDASCDVTGLIAELSERENDFFLL